MTNPYLIEGPALISFSGGRTSRYMLKHIVDAHGGTLPDDVVAVFANTGREMPETLDFVQRTGSEYNVPIVWLEYDPEEPHQTRIVSHNSASRNGEPFSALIRKRRMLPNPVTRFCTTEMKIRRFDMYARHWLGWDRWLSVVGLRADEPSRVNKLGPRNESRKDRWLTIAPLAQAGVTKAGVLAWSRSQPFDLDLEVDENGDTLLGNCDICFLKGRKKVERIMSQRPDLADWWINEEMNAAVRGTTRTAAAATFRADRPCYKALRDHALWIKEMKDERERKRALAEVTDTDDLGDCTCTD